MYFTQGAGIYGDVDFWYAAAMAQESGGPLEKKKIQEPYVLAMVVCDAIFRDPATRKATLLGTFSTLGATSFPAVHPVACIYVALTDGRGKCPITLKLVLVGDDASQDDTEIMETGGEVNFPDPRMIAELDLVLAGIQFPSAGEYRFQLWCNSTMLMERRILVAGPDGNGSEQDP